MTPDPVYTFTDDDLTEALRIATKRQLQNWARGIRSSAGAFGQGAFYHALGLHAVGACGELALCRLTGRQLRVGTLGHRDGDVDGVEVKTPQRSDGKLLLLPDVPDHRPVVLMRAGWLTDDATAVFRVRGWGIAGDLKRVGELVEGKRNSEGTVMPPLYFVSPHVMERGLPPPSCFTDPPANTEAAAIEARRERIRNIDLGKVAVAHGCPPNLLARGCVSLTRRVGGDGDRWRLINILEVRSWADTQRAADVRRSNRRAAAPSIVDAEGDDLDRLLADLDGAP